MSQFLDVLMVIHVHKFIYLDKYMLFMFSETRLAPSILTLLGFFSPASSINSETILGLKHASTDSLHLSFQKICLSCNDSWTRYAKERDDKRENYKYTENDIGAENVIFEKTQLLGIDRKFLTNHDIFEVHLINNIKIK